MTCPSCGTPAPDGARFCPSCGHTLVTLPDERRVTTVLFADLVGFTTFSETADPEHVKELVDRCFERLAADVNAFGGQVDKIVGDAIVALFGAPVAHEDDAERAVRAALQMQRTLAELREHHQIGVQMRIGVNTGEVLVGALRAGGDYTAMGDAVNTASRLQTAAAPGRVLVGPATFDATRKGIRYEALGPLTVKGREEQVEAWIALEPVAPPGQRAGRPRAPLVGRDAELDVLRTVLRTSVERRRTHLVLLTGEAGVGKTRLAKEVGAIAREEFGATVLLGHCAPYGEANVWFPIAEALRKSLAIGTSDPVETVRAKSRDAARAATDLPDDDPALARLEDGLLYLLGHAPPPDVEPARARDEALRSLITVLEGVARRQPVVLGLADLHWADELVLELIDRLMVRMRTLPFMLFGTARPELADRWTPQPGRHNAVVMNLDPLDADSSAELARALLGPDAADETVADVLDRSGGNPFFIEELAAVMAESEAHVPGTLQGLIAARIDGLDPAERATLEDCAVIGSGGSIELVTALAAARGHDEPCLDALVDQDLLELERNEYVFKTQLIRNVAYNRITKAERARLHSALTHHLADHAAKTGRVEEVLDAIAHHYGEAAELIAELGHVDGVPDDFNERAVKFLDRAAEKAAQQETWPVAKTLLSMALDVLGESDPERRFDLLLRRAKARTELRQPPAARADLEQAMAWAEAHGDAAAVATATTILGDVQFTEHDLAGSATTLAEAVQRWRELDDPAGLAEALRAQGMTEIFRGDLDDADRSLAEALGCFRHAQDRRGEAAALQNLAWISFYRGDLSEAEARLNESATAFAEVNDWGGIGWALGLMAWVRFQQGQLDEAERLATDILAEAGELGNVWASAMMQVLLANIALWRGNTGAAVEQAEGALGVFRDTDDAWGQTQALAPMVRALACLGRLGEAEAALDQAESLSRKVEDLAIRQFAPVVRGNVAVHTGEAGAAALVDGVELGRESEGIITERATVRGLAALQAGDATTAVGILEDSLERLGHVGPGAATAAALALAYDAVGRPDGALAACERAGAITFLDRLQVALARGFAHVQQGDYAAAEQAFWRALEIADRTDSRLDQAVVRVARARAWEAMARSDAGEARAEASARLDGLGIRAPGWETAFRLAAAPGSIAHA